MDQLVEIRNLSFIYDEQPVLENLNLSINRGDFLGIIGSNGSGKSTLIKLMLKILTPATGTIELLGEDIHSFRQWNKIGYVSQKAASFNSSFPATVEEVVQANLFSKVGLFKWPGKKHQSLIYEALEKVGMEKYGKRLIGNLSGGQQQRVFIARTLVSDPELLFLDEPTVGVDIKSEEAVYCLLARLNQELGLTVVMVTHDIGSITVHANRLLCLGEKGAIEHDPQLGITSQLLTEVYGYSASSHTHFHECKNCHRKEAL